MPEPVSFPRGSTSCPLHELVHKTLETTAAAAAARTTTLTLHVHLESHLRGRGYGVLL